MGHAQREADNIAGMAGEAESQIDVFGYPGSVSWGPGSHFIEVTPLCGDRRPTHWDILGVLRVKSGVIPSTLGCPGDAEGRPESRSVETNTPFRGAVGQNAMASRKCWVRRPESRFIETNVPICAQANGRRGRKTRKRRNGRPESCSAC